MHERFVSFSLTGSQRLVVFWNGIDGSSYHDPMRRRGTASEPVLELKMSLPTVQEDLSPCRLVEGCLVMHASIPSQSRPSIS